MEFLIVVGIVVGTGFYLWSLRPDKGYLTPSQAADKISKDFKQAEKQAAEEKSQIHILTKFLRLLEFNQKDIDHYLSHYPLLKDKCREVINIIPEVLPSLHHIPRQDLLQTRKHVEFVFGKHIQRHIEITNAIHAANVDTYKHILKSHLSEDEQSIASQQQNALDRQEKPQVSPIDYYPRTTVGAIEDNIHLEDESPVLVPTLSYGENIELDKHPLFSRMVTREHMRICCLGESVPVKANVRLVDIMERLSHPYPQIKDARVFLILNTIHFIPKED